MYIYSESVLPFTTYTVTFRHVLYPRQTLIFIFIITITLLFLLVCLYSINSKNINIIQTAMPRHCTLSCAVYIVDEKKRILDLQGMDKQATVFPKSLSFKTLLSINIETYSCYFHLLKLVQLN